MSKAVHPVVATVHRQHGNNPRPRIVPRQLEDDKMVVKPQICSELDTPEEQPAIARKAHAQKPAADVTRNNSDVSNTLITIQIPTICSQELLLHVLVVGS